MTFSSENFAHLAWAHLWQTTIVALVIGLIVRICCRSRPRLAYALWMLVIVKSLVPPVWSSPVGIFSWALADRAAVTDRGALTDSLAARTPQLIEPSEAANSPPQVSVVGDITSQDTHDLSGETIAKEYPERPRLHVIVFALWLTGLLLGAGYVLEKRLIAARLIHRSRLPVDERLSSALRNLSRQLGVKRNVRLIVTSRPIGPAAFGLFRPTILLPEALLNGTPPERVELVLAHELIHIRRRDVAASTVQLVAQLTWWFNPIIWWVNQKLTRERERCCDEELLSGLGCKPALYARTLLNVLELSGRLRSLVAQPGMRALEVNSQRLESIMKYAQIDHRWTVRISRICFLVGLLMLLPGTGLTLQQQLQANDDRGAAPAAADPTPEQQVQGTWTVARCEFSGKPDNEIVDVEHAIVDGKWFRPNRRTSMYRLKFDATKNPMWVDLSADRLGDRTLKGICALDGDKLTICYSYDPDLARPTEFKTTPDAQAYLYVLERVKVGAPKTTRRVESSPSIASAVPQPDLAAMQGKWRITRCEFTGGDSRSIVGTEDEIRGNSWLRSKRRTAEYRFHFDASQSPMLVDLSADRLGDETLKGICSLDGDTLKICYSYNPSAPRPTEFKTTPDVRAYLYVLERVKE
ncbi:MAG TPA: M56 family metallopeptidase [Pirellulales bacterium]|jgi:uncharacterized protein (TIGR03067 family)